MLPTFEVDKVGLAKLLERRGMAHIIYELAQNAWDASGVTTVFMSLMQEGAYPMRRVICEDNCPTGFKRLSDAWTLFAESEKKHDCEKRGRFNLGEKLVIALCRETSIKTTTGTVIFDNDGRRTTKQRTTEGSIVSALFKATNEQVQEMEDAARKLIVPAGINFQFNLVQLPQRKCVASFEVSIPTEVADNDGVLRRVTRKTIVELYEPLPGEVASIYEMGIPVVETRDKYHYVVQQRVPLTFERDNVQPSYLKTLRACALNATFASITTEDANAAWCREAAGDKRTVDEAIVKVADERFGKNRVSFDPTDIEANSTAQYRGATVIHGRNLSAEEWEQLRRANAILSAGVVFPTPQPYGNGPAEKIIAQADWTDDMRRAAAYVVTMGKYLLNEEVNIKITKAGTNFMACFSREMMQYTFNCNGGCTSRFFAGVGSVEFLDLMIHEFGHAFESDHRSENYHNALTRLGAKLTHLALEKPELFK